MSGCIECIYQLPKSGRWRRKESASEIETITGTGRNRGEEDNCNKQWLNG